jgi:hypothetical protein
VARKSASGDEAAAVAAAIARFEAELGGGVAAETGPALSGWHRAALLEGVGAKEPIDDSQGGSRWLS